MSTNCNFTNKIKKNLVKFFDKSVMTTIGKQSGFIQRKVKKISAYHFVLGFLLSCSKGVNSYTAWATQIGLLSGKTVSKQAVFDRIGEASVTFARQLVERVLLQSGRRQFSSTLFSPFKKVLLQDSTTLRLPRSLSWLFPGSRNQKGDHAIARIQSVLNLKAMNFLSFTLGSFRQNDQSASGSILPWVQKGDLVIRDLGYFAIKVLAQLIGKEVYFLSRLRFGVKIYDEHKREIPLKPKLEI